MPIICAVCYQRRDTGCDPIEKTHYFRYVADVVLRHFNDVDFMRVGIEPRCSLRQRRGEGIPCFWSSNSPLPKIFRPPLRLRDRSQQSLSLTQRLVEHQAKRKRDLDGYCRIDRSTATLSSRRSVPCHDGLFGTPNRQLSPPHQRSIIVWPIGHSAARAGPSTAVATANRSCYHVRLPTHWGGIHLRNLKLAGASNEPRFS